MSPVPSSQSTQNSGPSSHVYCCFKGCTVPVWVNTTAELIPETSSATCLGCRRIVFCLPHFTELYRGRSRYTCPQCGAAEWWLNRFGDDALDFEFQDTEEKRQQLQEEPSRASTTPPSEILNSTEEAAPPAPPPRLEWRLVSSNSLSDGYMRIGPKLAIREDGAYVEISTSGAPWTLKSRGLTTGGAISPAGQRVVIAQRSDADGISYLICHEFGTRPLILSAPKGAQFVQMRFFSENRFLYLLKEQTREMTLHEGIFEQNNRIHGRRIRKFGSAPVGPAFLVTHPGEQEVLTLRSNSQGSSELVAVSLATCQVRSMHAFDTSLRQLAVGRYGPTVAWITLDGRVCQFTRQGGVAHIGHSDESVLGVSDDGDQVAWLHRGRLEVVHLSAGTAHQYPAPEGGMDIHWAGRTIPTEANLR